MNSTSNPKRSIAPDPAAIVAAMRLILEPGQVTELRALDATLKGERRQGTVSGYFDDPQELARAVGRITSAKGTYVVINPVKPALLARAANRIRFCGKSDPTTSDHDVTARHWLPIDVDPVRPAGISASNAEHNAALAVARRIRDYLASCGWPDPIRADSGNGGHLLYRIDLEANDGGLVERCLAALDALFSDITVTVDTSVHNPARIWKLYGTAGCKGDDTAERPHRLARILEVPTLLCTVPRDLLEALAAQAPAPASPPASRSHNGTGQPFDVERWIAEYVRVPVEGPEPWQGGRRWVFPVCPWNPDHTNRSAYLLKHPSGAVSAGCHHNGCNGNGWHELRDVFEPGWRDRKAQHNGTAAAKPAKVKAPPAVKAEQQQPFPVEALPEPLRGYVTAGAKSIGCDTSFIALPLLSGVAAAIGNTRRVKIKDGWDEPAIIWTAIIGESGTAKSPAQDLALRAIHRAQRRALKRYDAELAVYESDLAAWQEHQRNNARKRKSDADEPPQPKPVEPVPLRYLVDDITVEAMARRLQDQRRGLLLARDELAGWLRSQNQYKGGRGSDAAHWLSMFGGRTLAVDRSTAGRRPIYVPNASVSITGGIQPAVLARALGQEHFDDGTAARLLLSWPTRLPRKWTDADVDRDTARNVESVFAALYCLEPGHDDEGDPCPILVPMDPDSKRLFRAFVDEHGEATFELTGALASAFVKLEAYAARLALVIHCVRQATGEILPNAPVDGASIAAAVILVQWFGREAKRVYAMLNESDEENDQRRLIEWIQARAGRTTARDLQHGGLRDYRRPGVAQAALDALVKAELAKWERQAAGSKGGKPTQECVLLADGDETDLFKPFQEDMSPMSPLDDGGGSTG